MQVARPSSTYTSTALSARPPLESPAKARQLTNTRTSASARGPRAAPTDVVPQWAPPPSNKLVDDKLNNVLSKLARRCDALAGTFHIEVARLEEASAREKKAAARARLQADAMHFATIEQREVMLQLQQEVDDAFNVSQKKKSKSQAWMGESEVRDVFKSPKVGAIAGCVVRTGVITRGSKVRFLRDGTIIWKGAIQSLRRFKDDVREVREGFECGLSLSDFQDLKQGDLIETYELRELARD